MNRGDYGPIPGIGYRYVRKVFTASAVWYAPSDTQPWTPFLFTVVGGGGTGNVTCCSGGAAGAGGGMASAERHGLSPGQAVSVTVGAVQSSSSVSLPAACKSSYSSGTITATGATEGIAGTGSGGDLNATGTTSPSAGLAFNSFGYGNGGVFGAGTPGLVLVEYWTQDQ